MPRRRILNDIAWCFGLAWSCSPWLLSLIGSTALLRGLAPVGLAIAARGIVNAVVQGPQAGDASASLSWWMAAGLSVAIVDSLSRCVSRVGVTLLEQKLDFRINSDILEHAGKLELAHFEDPRLQDTMARARDQVAKSFIKCLNSAVRAFSGAIQVVSLVGLLVRISPPVLFIVPLGLPYLWHQWKYSKRRLELVYTRGRRSRWTDYFVRQLTTHQSVPEVKVLGIASLLKDRYRKIAEAFVGQDRAIHLRRLRFDVVYVIVSTIAAYLAFYRVAVDAVAERLTVGDVAVFGGAAIRLATTIDNVVVHTARVREYVHHAANFREFLEVRPDRRPALCRPPAACRGEIELRRVTFKYAGSPTPVLQDVSLHIRPGETIALVGENGSGKTTLMKLLAGLYAPTMGRVFLDGHDVSTLSPEFMRRHVSIVFQEHGRYEATAEENIAYGDWDRCREHPELVRRGAALAGIEHLIEMMPQGYETMLGREFGEFTLSVGQWQQLAVARALVKESAVLVLDEPTASMDAIAERRLVKRFAEIARGRTTILISHRLSTIRIADRIVVLAEGRVEEQGTHAELLVANGRYTRFHRTYRS